MRSTERRVSGIPGVCMSVFEEAAKEVGPTLLLTNDDGWDAPGLAALRQASAVLGRCCVVAPSGPISGCGHRVTTHGPLVVTRPNEGSLAVAGTPADCVRLALHHLVPGPRLGPGGHQCRRQSWHRHPLFGHGRGRARGRHPRCSRNRLVALYRTGPRHRLGPRGAVGQRWFSAR